MKAIKCMTVEGLECWYLGTTASRTVWVVYREEDVAEVWPAFAKVVKRGGHASAKTELLELKRQGISFGGFQWGATLDDFMINREERLAELEADLAVPAIRPGQEVGDSESCAPSSSIAG